MRDANPKDLPSAELYVFSSPGRFGKPKRDARRFLRNVSLKPGTLYAVLTTQGAPKPDAKTGKMPSQQEQDRWERVIPIMNQLLEAKGLHKAAQTAVLVTGLKGPLEDGWQDKVAAFADQVAASLPSRKPGTRCDAAGAAASAIAGRRRRSRGEARGQRRIAGYRSRRPVYPRTMKTS